MTDFTVVVPCGLGTILYRCICEEVATSGRGGSGSVSMLELMFAMLKMVVEKNRGLPRLVPQQERLVGCSVLCRLFTSLPTTLPSEFTNSTEVALSCPFTLSPWASGYCILFN